MGAYEKTKQQEKCYLAQKRVPTQMLLIKTKRRCKLYGKKPKRKYERKKKKNAPFN